MGRGLLSLLLLACCLLAGVQVSKAAPDDSNGAKTPPPGNDPRSQRDADAPDATATVLDAAVNGTDGVNEATFVNRVSGNLDSQSSDIDKGGGDHCYTC